MTSDPKTLSADASLLEAMQAMESGHYRNVPLTSGMGPSSACSASRT